MTITMSTVEFPAAPIPTKDWRAEKMIELLVTPTRMQKMAVQCRVMLRAV
jgi:hypothetical protein